RVEDRVAVGIGGHGDAESRHRLAHDGEVTLGILLFSEASPGNLAGGVVDGADQAQIRTAALEPVVAAGIHLQQHAFLGIAVTTAPVFGRSSTAWRAMPARSRIRRTVGARRPFLCRTPSAPDRQRL